MNTNPLLKREIGTRRDKQYKAGEIELIKIIKRKNKISHFDPYSSNLNAFLKDNERNLIFSLN